MEAADYLKDYISKTTPLLKDVFQEYRGTAVRVSPVAVEMIDRYERFMGGKNIRGALTKFGYEIFGGKDEKAILFASIMVEITHAWILMHDDVMDEDLLRRGQPTMHIQYQNYHQNNLVKGESGHFGLSLAVDTGDAGFALAQLVLNNSRFPAEIIKRVSTRLNQIILKTAFGQAIDMVYENRERVTEEDVLRVHHFKTADYTITGPLQYGALFAGITEGKIEKIADYGTPVGVAFQLRDDELGLYSDEDKLGKPIGSDIREGKNTILRVKAVEWARGADREFLLAAYGKKDLAKEDVLRVRRITQKTGALAYSQKLGRELVNQGKKHISTITDNPDYQVMLAKVADYMIERDS